MRVAILGAECTGKTHLARSLAVDLANHYAPVAWQPEALREWCNVHGRTPLAHEQASIAHAHMDSILHHPENALLVCDTTPLMTAVYSDVIFGDTSLYPLALAWQGAFSLTLLTGLDVPWVADGFQRDGPAMRARIDARLREILVENSIAFSTLYGDASARLTHARQSILRVIGVQPESRGGTWKWNCEKCSDPACEHRLFSDLTKGT